jgi:hypothetical protein
MEVTITERKNRYLLGDFVMYFPNNKRRKSEKEVWDIQTNHEKITLPAALLPPVLVVWRSYLLLAFPSHLQEQGLL